MSGSQEERRAGLRMWTKWVCNTDPDASAGFARRLQAVPTGHHEPLPTTLLPSLRRSKDHQGVIGRFGAFAAFSPW